MLTPSFEVDQDESHVLLRIYVPYVRMQGMDFLVVDNVLRFHCKPYFLRLTFEDKLHDQEDLHTGDYNFETGWLLLRLAKATPGQNFKELHLMSKLLLNSTETMTSDGRKKIPAVEVIQNYEEYRQLDVDDIDWEMTQEVEEDESTSTPAPSLEGGEGSSGTSALLEKSECKYGFNSMYINFFKGLQYEIGEIIDIPEPDITPMKARRRKREKEETFSFSVDHYVADTYELGRSKEEILSEHPHFGVRGFWCDWKEGEGKVETQTQTPTQEETRVDEGQACEQEAKTENEILHPGSFGLAQKERKRNEEEKENEKEGGNAEEGASRLSKSERDALRSIPSRPYLVDHPLRELLSIVDVLLAFAYDYRITMAEHNCESGWTIRKLSGTLSWFDVYRSPKEVTISFFRRALCYPLHRNMILCEMALEDVRKMLRAGRLCVLKILLQIKLLLEKREHGHTYTNLYIDHFCVWWQFVSPQAILRLSDEMEKVKVEKEHLNMDLETKEKIALQKILMEDEEEEEAE